MASSDRMGEETLICPVCLETYNETNHKPMVLGNCGHSICLSCLDPLTRHGQVSCPKCRVKTQSRAIKVNYDLRDAAIHNRWQAKALDEKDEGKELPQEPRTPPSKVPPAYVVPPQQQEQSSGEMDGWLAAGAVAVGAAIFGLTGFALGRYSNRQKK